MKKLLLIALLFTGVLQAQIVNIPDAKFLEKLIAVGVDSNGDGQIQVSEALAVTTLDVHGNSIFVPDGDYIEQLTGIEAFTNLTHLDFSANSVSLADLSTLTNLTELKFDFNHLSAVDLGNLQNLTTLICDFNDLIALDTSSLSNLLILTCSSNELTSLNLSNLTNLTKLVCYDNDITTLDFTGLAANLEYVDCSANPLGTLDVNMLTNLKHLQCEATGIYVLNVSNLVHLEYLVCYGNGISSIDFTNLSNLTAFSCYDCPFSSLDFSLIPNLTYLAVGNPGLAQVDITMLHQLETLNYLGGNQVSFDFTNLTKLKSVLVTSGLITTLDVSMCHELTTFMLGFCPQLHQMFLKTGSPFSFGSFDVGYLPSLEYVCIDPFNQSIVQSELQIENFNFVINSYCSFEPGGDYNTITGTNLFDGDNNGCDANDNAASFVKARINDGVNQGVSFANNMGNYKFYTAAGNFTVTPELENSTFFTLNPANVVVNFPLDDNSVSTNNFCIAANGVHPDIEIVIAPVTPARPGFDATYLITYKNKGNQIMTQPYGIAFFYNQNLMSFSSANEIPATSGPGALTWDYSNLMPFESRSIYVILHVNAPTDINPVNIGDILDFNANISPVGSDENMADNYSVYHQIVVGSFDPNDITCIEGDVVAPSEIGNYLHYIINFENTGTDYAQNIVIKDIIDPAKFDISSLQILSSSHPLDARINGNIAEFIFKNINLDTGGHGNVLLKIKSNDNLVSGNSVAAKGDIYFDYNFPVATNTANTTFQTLGIDDNPWDANIAIYPNPAHDVVNIKANSAIKSIQLFDVQGRILQTRLTNENVVDIDISTHSNGIYFLKIASEKGIRIEKIIKK